VCLHTRRPARTLDNVCRTGSPEFRTYKTLIPLDDPEAYESPRAWVDIVMTLHTTARNFTGRTITGLEVHAAVIDHQNQPVKERTLVVLPNSRPTLVLSAIALLALAFLELPLQFFGAGIAVVEPVVGLFHGLGAVDAFAQIRRTERDDMRASRVDAHDDMGLWNQAAARATVTALRRRGVIAVALQRYGMILADNGSPWYISGAPNSRWIKDAVEGSGMSGEIVEQMMRSSC